MLSNDESYAIIDGDPTSSPPHHPFHLHHLLASPDRVWAVWILEIQSIEHIGHDRLIKVDNGQILAGGLDLLAHLHTSA